MEKKIFAFKFKLNSYFFKFSFPNFSASNVIESAEGPARKYYRITEKGRSHVKNMISEYLAFNEKVMQIIKA